MPTENQDLLMRLHNSNQKLHKLLAKKFEDAGLNKSEFFLLCLIHKNNTAENKPTLSQISKEINISKPAVTQITASLKKKGLIKRSIDKDDNRCVHFKLTAKGEDTIKSQAAVFSSAISSAFSEAGIESTNNFLSLFESIVDSLEGLLSYTERECAE